MVGIFDKLLEKYQVCVISGGKYELFQRQFLTQITNKPELLEHLHLMPTSGTRYYRFENGDWVEKYAENIAPENRRKIIDALANGLRESGYEAAKTYGETIENRDNQITLSILPQQTTATLTHVCS